MAVASEKLFRLPLDLRFVAVLIICSLCTLGSTVSCFRLALRHLRAGQALTGTLAPHERSVNFAMFVLNVPLFAMLSLLSVVLVELAPVWHFLQTLALAVNFWRVPGLFLFLVGGRVRLQLKLRERLESGEAQPVRLYGQVPCCCARICLKPRIPCPSDLPMLRFSILQLCLVVPLVELFDLVVIQESIMRASFVHMFASRQLVLHLVLLTSQTSCMSSCRGLAQLVSECSSGRAQVAILAKVQQYCQSYLLGMNLLPTLLKGSFFALWGSRNLGNGATLSQLELTNFCHSVLVCVATLFCARNAWKAFPVNGFNYPELYEEESAGLADALLKLRSLQHCPFCGSSRLDKDANTFDEPTASCRDCGARGIPLQLETW